MGRTRTRGQQDGDGDIGDRIAKRRWTEAEAWTIVEAQRRSGVSLAAFARRHRLSPQRLYDWRRRLDVVVAPRFLPVTLKPTPVPTSDGTAVTILLRGGRAVRVAPGFDDRMLARVVEVLEGLPC
jgi:hypothetical protein